MFSVGSCLLYNEDAKGMRAPVDQRNFYNMSNLKYRVVVRDNAQFVHQSFCRLSIRPGRG